MNDPVPTAPAPRRRRWLRITLIAAAVLLLLIGLLPMLASGFVGSYVASDFAATHMGRLDIDELSLGWFSRQEVRQARLLDPDGAEVAVVSVELPSLLGILSGGGTELGRIQLRGSVNLSADDAGTTNLDRALAPRGSPPPPASPPSNESTDLGALLRRLDLEVDVALDSVRWDDARTRAIGRPVTIEGFTAQLIAEPGQPIRVTANGTIAGDKPGQLRLAAALHDLFDTQGISPDARCDLDLQLDALPSALVDTVIQQDRIMATAFGPEFRVTAKGQASLTTGNLQFEVAGARGTLRLDGQIEDSVLRANNGAALTVAMRPDRASLERLLTRLVPSLTLTPVGEPQLDIALTELRLELRPILAALNAGHDLVPSITGATELVLSVSGSGWNASGDTIPLEGGVAVQSPQLLVRLAAAESARQLAVEVNGQLGGGLSGAFTAAVHCDDLAAMLARDPAELVAATTGTEPRFDLTVAVQQFDPAGLAALAPADLRLAELLGGTVDLRFEAGNRGPAREAGLRLTAPNVEVALAGWLSDGALVGSPTRDSTIELRTASKAWVDLIAAQLPAGTTVALGESVRIRLDKAMRVPLLALADAADPLATLLQHAELRADVAVDRFGIATPELAAANQQLVVRGVGLSAILTHAAGAPPLQVSLTGALADARGGAFSIVATCPTPGALDGLTDLRAVAALDLEASVSQLSTALLDAFGANDGKLAAMLGPELGLQLRVHATQDDNAQLAVELQTGLTSAPGETTVRATVAVADPLQRRAARATGAWPTAQATFEVQGFSAFESLLSADLATSVRELLGEQLRGRVGVVPAAGAIGAEGASLSAALDGDRVAMKFAGRVRGNALRIQDEPFELRLRPTTAMVGRHLGANLPAGASIALAGAEPELAVSVSAVELPLSAWLVAAGEVPTPLPDVLRATTATVAVQLPNLIYTSPPGAGSTAPVAIDALRLDAVLAGAAPAVVDLRGAIGGDQAGAIAVHATLADLGAWVDRAEGAAPPPIAATGDLTAVPTALIDALAAQDGLLVDTLGPQLNVKLRGTYPDQQDPLRVELRSNTATVTLVARLADGTLEADGDSGLDASLPLTPLLSQRIVGSLVPLLVQATKPAGAAPIGLSMRSFRLPLDADLRRLSGTVVLDLGDIGYQLLPGLGEYLTAAGLPNVAVATAHLPTLTIAIRDGVAGYDALPLSIGGRDYVFKGSYNLATAEMDFATEVPLSIVGKKLSSQLEKARKFLDPQLLVPIEIKGTWSKPRLAVGDKFLRDVAANALQRGLLDIFRKKNEP